MNILIAEDDPISAMALRRVLEKNGYSVTTKINGAEALVAWQQGHYPIIITDWMMPELDGLAVCRSIRQSARRPYTCIIMLTAKQTSEDRVQALSVGADIFLTRPLIADDLVARIQVAERILLMEEELTV
jgi:DNA-binding response OmpR family regulator